MINEKIYDYCVQFSTPESSLLHELRRETFLKTLNPHMISGELQGQILTMLVKMLKPKTALEIGTFTGYASLCIAEGMQERCTLYTIEKELELVYFHEKYFNLSDHGDKIKTLYGDANSILNEMNEKFDFVFMDAGKKDYSKQFELIIEKMNSGAVILADNVLWKSKVLEKDMDKMTQYIHEFNQMILEDHRVSNVILPIRDGINVIMKN